MNRTPNDAWLAAMDLASQKRRLRARRHELILEILDYLALCDDPGEIETLAHLLGQLKTIKVN